MDEFITRNEDLYDRYIDFLIELKDNPEWSEFNREIEMALFEFGMDEEWLEQQSEGVIN